MSGTILDIGCILMNKIGKLPVAIKLNEVG